MHLTLDIDLDRLTGDPATELGRILRYWGGAMTQVDLAAPFEHDLSDSEYQPVGTIRLA